MTEMSRSLRHRGTRFAITVALATLAALVFLAVSLSSRGEAAFPGANGRIAYVHRDSETSETDTIWSANADGSSATKLTSGYDYSPAYSADGSRIAFTRESGGNALYVMNADGSGQTQLAHGSTSSSSHTTWRENYEDPKTKEVIPFVRIVTFEFGWHSYGSPAFSPDGSQLAVDESHGTEVEKEICAVEVAEGEECIEEYEPESYFNYEFECSGCASRIVTLNSTTGAQTGEVTSFDSGHEDYGPTYSADGKLAFTRGTESDEHWSSSIFVVSSPGASPVPVTSGPEDGAPDFSPDGTRIVFVRGENQLGIVGAGGGSVSTFTIPPPGGTIFYSSIGSPVFSPDGSKIAFQRFAYGSSGEVDSGVFTISPDGSGMTRIIPGGFEPSWQPLKVTPPPPPPPVPAKTKAKKSAKLNKKKQAVIGTIACGSSPCTLKALSGFLKVSGPMGKKHGKRSAMASRKAGSKAYRVKIGVTKHLAAGKTTPVKVTVKGKALAALEAAKSGKLTAKVSVAEALGKKVVTLKTTLKAPKPKHKKKH